MYTSTPMGPIYFSTPWTEAKPGMHYRNIEKHALRVELTIHGPRKGDGPHTWSARVYSSPVRSEEGEAESYGAAVDACEEAGRRLLADRGERE